MNRYPLILTLLAPLAGCGMATEAPAPAPPPAVSRPAEAPVVPRATSSRFTGVTRRDEVFAEFLREKAGGMVRQASVNLEKSGDLRIELDKSVAPDDTLPLTNSLLAGARRDFPDQPIKMTVYDPNGDLVLRARYEAGRGVQYKIAGEDKTITAAAPNAPEPSRSQAPSAPRATESPRTGTTAADQKFAAWAEDHGKSYLRYVEADLERHGRLWFGVTPEVKPADVPNLTKSLLEGAHKEFPNGDLTALVFDPEGQKIGRATMTRDGSIHWDK